MSSVAVVALDIHKKFSKAVVMNGKGEVVSEKRVSHESSVGMEEFLAQFEAATDVVMEATFNWPWIADIAQEMGLAPHLAHPPRVREMAKGMAKSDRKDAVYLGKLWLAGDIFPRSYLAPPEVRRMRGLFRLRLVLVRMRTAIKNAIHGQLHRQGILIEDCSDLFGRKGRLILESLWMPEAGRWQLEQKLSVLDELAKRIRRPRLLSMKRGSQMKRPAGRLLSKAPRRQSSKLTAEQRLLILDTWGRSGLPAAEFASIVGVSKHTLYVWKKRFEEMGPAGLMDQPRGGPEGSRLPETTKRAILMIKGANPEYGCRRISEMLLRGPALPASPGAVARVLKEAGYETEEVPTVRNPERPRRFERARANQLWQTDIPASVNREARYRSLGMRPLPAKPSCQLVTPCNNSATFLQLLCSN